MGKPTGDWGRGGDKMMSCSNYLLLLECCDLGNVVYSLMVDSKSTLFGIGEVIDVVCVCACVEGGGV